jgi:hypothetical protein
MRARLVLPFLLLAGCAGPSPQEIAASASADCSAYGFQYGTPEYGQCMMQKSGQAHQLEMQRRENLSRSLDNWTPIEAPTYGRPGVQANCTSQRQMDGSVRTVCN